MSCREFSVACGKVLELDLTKKTSVKDESSDIGAGNSTKLGPHAFSVNQRSLAGSFQCWSFIICPTRRQYKYLLFSMEMREIIKNKHFFARCVVTSLSNMKNH